MIYVSLVCFVLSIILVFRSIFGYEEIKADNMWDRGLLALLWLNITLVLLEDIASYMGN